MLTIPILVTPILAIGPNFQPVSDWFRGLVILAVAAVAAYNVFWVLLVKKQIGKAFEIFGAIFAVVFVVYDWAGVVSLAKSLGSLLDSSAAAGP